MNSFDGQKISTFHPIHELLRFVLLVSSFLNFSVEEDMLSFLDHILELLPFFHSSRLSTHIQISTTIFISPCFRAFCDICSLGEFKPYSVNIAYKGLDDGFKSIDIWNWFGVDTLDVINKFIDEVFFLFTILE